MKTETAQQSAEINGSYITPDGKAQIDFGITYRNAKGVPQFHVQGYYNGSAGQCLDEIKAAYPDDKEVQLWYKRWKLHHLKDATMIRGLVEAEARKHPARSFYEHQAQTFLTTNGLRLRTTLSDSKPAPWGEEKHPKHHFRVTIWHNKGTIFDGQNDKRPHCKQSKLTFDFWSGDTSVSAYTVLACIASDAHCPFTFEDFCAEYDYNSDSLKDKQTFNRCASFARRLRAFFTPAELEQLSAIQ